MDTCQQLWTIFIARMSLVSFAVVFVPSRNVFSQEASRDETRKNRNQTSGESYKPRGNEVLQFARIPVLFSARSLLVVVRFLAVHISV